jgi:response regulator of citrate/malate metabolism
MIFLSDTMVNVNEIFYIAGAVAVFLIFHFTAIGRLKERIHQLELKMKDLEKSDALQQQVIDQLSKVFDFVHKKKESEEKKGGK